jgi:hypothetical protein
MVEQATKVLNSVHKRMHSAQAEEFALLVRCFREHPESFWQRCKRPTIEWNEQTFMQALNDCELVPQADPNTASHTQRIMKVMALKQLQAANPSMYDPIAIDTAALKAIGWSNPEQFLVPESASANPPPELLEAQAKIQNDSARAQATTMDAQTKAQQAQHKQQLDMAKLQIEAMRAQGQLAKDEKDIGSRAADRASRERMNLIDLAQNLAVHPYSADLVAPLIEPALEEIDKQEQIAQSGGIMPSGVK